MRLIQQYALTFSRSGSDKVKVFEIDLCEVGAGRFVVNYRYGRQNHPLRDGTRTLSPVSRSEADDTLDRLLTDKLRSGYQLASQQAADGAARSSAPVAPVAPATATATPATPHTHQPAPVWSSPPRPADGPDVSGASSREDAILRWLDWHRAPPTGAQARWPLHRVAWRAGELRMAEATPHLIALLSGEHGPDYAIAWALGRCGGAGAVETLRGLVAHDSPSVQAITTSSLSMLLTGEALAAWRAGLLDSLPQPLQSALGMGRLDAIQEAISASPQELITVLYATREPALRGSLLGLADVLDPALPADLAALRALLQLAGHHDDIPLLVAVLARLESSGIALEAGARDKLLLRPWRILRRLRDDGDPRWPDAGLAALRALRDATLPASRAARLAAHIAEVVAAIPLDDAAIALLTEARCQAVIEALSAHLQPADPTPAFLQSLLSARHPAARAAGRAALAGVSVQAHADWIAADCEALLSHTALLAACISHPDPAIQAATRDLLARAPLDAPARAALVQGALEALLTDVVADDTADAAVQILWLVLPVELRDLPRPMIIRLVRSGRSALQGLGGARLLSWAAVPAELLGALLGSNHPDARAAGVRLLQKLTDGQLLQHESAILTLCTDPDPVVRQGGAGLLGRLLIGASGARIAAGLLKDRS